MSDKDDPVLEELNKLSLLCFTPETKTTIDKAIAVQKAQARVVEAARAVTTNYDLNRALAALDEVKK